MSAPSEIKRVSVVERIVTVLKAIRAGSDYFLTPASVEHRFIHWKEVTRGPALSVHADSGEAEIRDGMNHWRTMNFYVDIKGIVVSEKDAVTAILHAHRDACRAIDEDMKSSATGSLGALCDGLFFEGIETDNGCLSLEGKGYFEQRIRIVISGLIGTL